MSRLLLRNLFDSMISAVPATLMRGLLKSIENHPEIGMRAGFRVFPQKFDTPLVNPEEIDRKKLLEKRDLPGIRIDTEKVIALMRLLAPYCKELDVLPGTGDPLWYGTYPVIDSTFLYCMVRHLKPKRYIEVGCGYSSRVSSMALRKNVAEGHPCQVTYIEPYPGWRLEGVDLFGELLQKRIEDVPVEYFRELGENDILFIDTSHVIKAQNDVEYELLHVLPALRPGVQIHIHDIFTPYDQPVDTILGPGHGNYWGFRNEQYVLECLLSCTTEFEITLPLHLMQRDPSRSDSERRPRRAGPGAGVLGGQTVGANFDHDPEKAARLAF